MEALSVDEKYLLLCLDPDAPHPSTSLLLSPILHWFQAGLQSDGTGALQTSELPAACYRAPNAPAFSPPHRYVFLLYRQPELLDLGRYAAKEGEEMGLWPRIKYKHGALVQELSLGKVVAANYFMSK